VEDCYNLVVLFLYFHPQISRDVAEPIFVKLCVRVRVRACVRGGMQERRGSGGDGTSGLYGARED